MKRTLAIDPGTHLGWALRHHGKILYDTKSFTSKKCEGQIHAELYDWLSAFLKKTRPEEVVIEAAFFRGANSQFLYGFPVIVGLLCWRLSTPVIKVSATTVKKHLTGKGSAAKGEMEAAVRELGFAPRTDHEADAIAILRWREMCRG